VIVKRNDFCELQAESKQKKPQIKGEVVSSRILFNWQTNFNTIHLFSLLFRDELLSEYPDHKKQLLYEVICGMV
jgi:hypothetical protein